MGTKRGKDLSVRSYRKRPEDINWLQEGSPGRVLDRKKPRLHPGASADHHRLLKESPPRWDGPADPNLVKEQWKRQYAIPEPAEGRFGFRRTPGLYRGWQHQRHPRS